MEFQTSESAELSFSFLAFMVLATMIAALGIIQDSLILIIGAMVVGPEFGHLPGSAWRSSSGSEISLDGLSARSRSAFRWVSSLHSY